MDRNSIIGFVLLLLIGGGYLFWAQSEQKELAAQKQVDSLANEVIQRSIDSIKVEHAASSNVAEADSSLPNAFRGTNETVVLENEEVAITFNSQGGYPRAAQLKKFKTYKQESLFIFNGDNNKLNFNLPINGQTVSSETLFFTPSLQTLADGQQQLMLTAEVGNQRKVILSYVLPKDGYMLTANLRLIGLDKDLSRVTTIPLRWSTEILHTEKSLKNERLNAQIHFRQTDGEHDYFTLQRDNAKNFSDPMQWFSVRAHFFNSTIIADKEMRAASYSSQEPAGDSNVVVANVTSFEIPSQATSDFSFAFRWHLGPNDYKLLKSYNLDMEEMVQLGIGPFFFVKYISKWIIIPLFDLLNSFIGSMGLIIILITLIIRACLSFFSYKSYLSTAKMRALKPELDALKERLGDNQQQIAMEQMKLYKTAGVNPLGGCLPMLLQMPFLLAMYYFFPTSIDLRQAKFLWAEDLSTYDSILSLPFNIPFYGDHVSLFTLLMTVSSLALAIYSRNMNPTMGNSNDANMIMLKWMPMIMPILFLGWFNSMAAGLTFYYTFSNIISLVQQFVIQKFIINEDKIRLKIEANKNKPQMPSKWQQRMEEMQRQQAERMKGKK